jgi:hypothetical protein
LWNKKIIIFFRWQWEDCKCNVLEKWNKKKKKERIVIFKWIKIAHLQCKWQKKYLMRIHKRKRQFLLSQVFWLIINIEIGQRLRNERFIKSGLTWKSLEFPSNFIRRHKNIETCSRSPHTLFSSTKQRRIVWKKILRVDVISTPMDITITARMVRHWFVIFFLSSSRQNDKSDFIWWRCFFCVC